MKVVLDYNIVFSAPYNRGTAQELFVKNHVSRTFEFLVPAYFWEGLRGSEYMPRPEGRPLRCPRHGNGHTAFDRR